MASGILAISTVWQEEYVKLCYLGSLPRVQAIVKPVDFELKEKKYKYGKVLR